MGNDEFKPVFIVGNARSGTTLVAAIMDRHKKLSITPETHFFYQTLPKNWRSIERDLHKRDSAHELLVRYMVESPNYKDLSLDLNQLMQNFILQKPTFSELFKAVLETYRQQQGAVHVGEKTPWHLIYVDTILSWYTDAKVIFVIRDGRDVIQSLMNASFAHKNFDSHAIAWCSSSRKCLNYLKNYPEHVTCVRLEDLVLNPEGEVARLDEFVGLEFDPNQLDSNIPTKVVAEHEKSFKQQSTRQIDAQNIYKWKNKLTTKELNEINSLLGYYLKAFNYPEYELKDCSLKERIRLYLQWYWIYFKHIVSKTFSLDS